MTMSSKLDFNVILAKAEKNSSQAQKLLEEKKIQQRKLLDQKKSQPSKQAAMAYLEKKKEEAKRRAEQEAKELLEKKRKKVLTENPTVPKKSEKSKKPESSKPATVKTQAPKPSVQTSKQHSKSSSTGKNVKPNNAAVQKSALSYQDVLRLADQNKDKPKAPGAIKPKEVVSKTNKTKAEEPSSSATASSSSSLASKLTPEQIAKLKEKQKKPNVLPSKPAPTRTDINNNKNKIMEKSGSKSSLIEPKISKPNHPSLSAWDRIMSDMKKNPSIKKTLGKKNVNNNESDEGEYEDEEEEYDSEMEGFIDDEEEDNEEYRKYIRKMFKYDPTRYKDEDDDIDNMETDYHSLQREEKRSLKLGIMEDIEEMKREAEMERRRLEKKKKRHHDPESEKSSEKKIKK
ncbi:SPT2 -like protein [Brachionus plicatilis]|uniref:SPT2-like protein n=1 Tax=Brachionus plicatilis TaxID=10195 RepID=A0A3M7RUM3_BRAPC|nr:SPT2 -like protein [Brachionus plicatilis]